MKAALPPNGKLSKELKECMQECVSEFILFITSQLSDRCLLEKRKTMNGEDILWSMYTLGFEHYAEMLKIYLAKYREFEAIQAAQRPRRVRKKKPRSQQQSQPNLDSQSLEYGLCSVLPDFLPEEQQHQHLNEDDAIAQPIPESTQLISQPHSYNPPEHQYNPQYANNEWFDEWA